MAIQLRSTLKKWFGRGCYPTASQFADMIDSYVHREEDKLLITSVAGLPEAINGKYDKGKGDALAVEVETLGNNVATLSDAVGLLTDELSPMSDREVTDLLVEAGFESATPGVIITS